MNKNNDMRTVIKNIYNELSPKEQLAADFVMSKRNDLLNMTINDISDELGIATSTFFQFTKKLGYSGFSEFKIALASENPKFSLSIHEKIDVDDHPNSIFTKVLNSSIKSLQDTLRMTNFQDFEKAVELLNNADRVFFFGFGGSNSVAFDAYHKFLRSPLDVVHTVDSHTQLMHAALSSPNDCAVLISHSGRTHDSVMLSETLKDNKTPILAITSHPLSPVAQNADVSLISYADETSFRSESLASRISQLAIIDSLFVACSFSNEEQTKESTRKVRASISRTR